MAEDLLALAHELARRSEPFVLATVVRCERPTSAKPGAKALIRQDGAVSGWIGGSCAEPIVVREALKALADAQPRFIALMGEGSTGLEKREGVLEYAMTCHSGGTLEIYIEPFLPKPELLLFGRGPVVETLEKLGQAMGFTVHVVSSEAPAEGIRQLRKAQRTFVVVATHGTFDEEVLAETLRGEVGYVSLVASRRRAAAVVESLRARGIPAEQLGRLKAPAGLDISAVTPEEIAVSILAEIIQASRSQKVDWSTAETPPGAAGLTQATDPVCGMSVEIISAKYLSEAYGSRFYFCCARCKQLFERSPARYARGAGG